MIVGYQRDGPKDARQGRTLFTSAGPWRNSGPLYLSISVDRNRYTFSYGYPNPSRDRRPPVWKTLGTIESDSLTTKTAGGFVGSVFGLLAATGE